MRKITVISLLAIVFLSQCGYYCYCGIQLYLAKEAARKELLKEIPENLLVKIAVDGNRSIQWEEEDEEFSLDGAMYDVAKIKYENGKKYAYCISDEKEDQVNAALENVIKSNLTNNPDNSKHPSAAKITIPDWIMELQPVISFQVGLITQNREYYTYKSSLYYHHIEVISPPPDLNFILNNHKHEKIYTTTVVTVHGMRFFSRSIPCIV
ncbi:hypothetical protein [Ferruginibacter sp.]